MDDVADFEARFQSRLRTFAAIGIRPADASAVARAVIGGRHARLGAGSDLSRRGRPFDRWFGWVALGAAVIVALTVVLPLLPAAITGRPSPTPTSFPTEGLLPSAPATASPEPSPSAVATPTRLGIAYWGEFTGIYVMDWERGEPVAIFDDASAPKCEQASSVSLSPDGRWIAYRTGVYSRVSNAMGDCTALTHIMDLSGRTIASFPGWGELGVPWSHDSSLVATWLDLSESRAIGIYGLDGQRRALVFAPERSGEYDVSWSPDGSPSVHARGWEIPIDGSPARPYEVPPVLYSPDGQHLAVIKEASMIITTRDGAAVRELPLEHPVDYVTWSPSGDHIVYARGNDLGRVDVESGAVTMLTSSTERIRPILGVSPDGTWVLFVVGRNADSLGDLWVVNTTGGEARMIAEDVAGAGWIALPDVR